MAEPMENVAYLAQSIGPRPAGTEEEQQAALYITEEIQRDSGLAAVIEDFNCSPDHDIPRVVLCVVSLLMALVAMFVQVMVIPTLIVTLVCAVLYVTESLGRTKLSRLLGNGVSQNVVAKYVPAPSEDAPAPRRRKVILVAHYDSGKTRKGTLGKAGVAQIIAITGLFVIPLIMLVRSVLTFGGTTLIAVNVLTGAAMLCAALPIAQFVVNRAAPYNEAANCNASGVAVLMEVAKRIGYAGSSSSWDYYAESASAPRRDPEVHGEEAARAAGLIPEEAELVYEVSAMPSVADPDLPEGSPAARLLAAKAAVAALTGKPVSSSVNIEFEESADEKDAPREGLSNGMVWGDVFEAEDFEEIAESPESSEPGSETVPAVAFGEAAPSEGEDSEPQVLESSFAAPATEKSDVPDWFRKAQEKAKKPAADANPAYRSRYADALDAAARESAARAQAAEEEASRTAISETEERLQRVRESIMEVRAPRIGEPRVTKAPSEQPGDVDSSLAEGAEVSAVGVAAAAVMGAAGAAGAAVAAASEVAAAAPIASSSSQSAQSEQKASAAAVPSAAKKPQPRKKRAIALPSIGKAIGREEAAEGADSSEGASAAEGKASAIQNLRARIPSIGSSTDASAESQAKEPKARPVRRSAAKIANLPAISSESDVAEGQTDSAASSPASTLGVANLKVSVPEVSSVDSAAEADLGATTAFMPYDLSDVADSADEVTITNQIEDLPWPDEEGPEAEEHESEVSAPASQPVAHPGYSKMPKSRIQGFLGRFAKNNGERRSVKQEHMTPQEWLEVDSDFDARTVGAARGGWESFRQDEADYEEPAADVRYTGELEAAFSDEDEFTGRRGGGRRTRRWEGGAVSRERLGRVSMLSGEADAEEFVAEARAAEEGVYRFRHPDIDIEVWFVALGSELAANGGMEAFMAEHASDLRGAVIVELEGLGAGDLAVVEREGLNKTVSSPSRMRRYAAKASAEFGIPLAHIDIDWRETSAAYAMRRGYQALHLVGALDGKPARFGREDDVVANVDEETLMRNADFVMELLKQI